MGEELERLDTLHHVALPVSDIAAAAAWYTSRFRCRVAYQDETWAMLEFANARIALVLPTQHPGHVAFEQDDASQFGAVRRHRDGSEYVYLDDPFGNRIEVLQRGSIAERHKPARP